MQEAIDKARRDYPMLDIDTNGTIFSNGKDAARWLQTTNQWVNRDAWGTTEVNWARFWESLAR